MNIPVPIGRLLLMLPCGMCGDPGPHAFRVQREHGVSVVCVDCRPVQHPAASGVPQLREASEAAQHESEGSGNMAGIHGPTVTR